MNLRVWNAVGSDCFDLQRKDSSTLHNLRFSVTISCRCPKVIVNEMSAYVNSVICPFLGISQSKRLTEILNGNI